jgi:hypothetical protein
MRPLMILAVCGLAVSCTKIIYEYPDAGQDSGLSTDAGPSKCIGSGDNCLRPDGGGECCGGSLCQPNFATGTHTCVVQGLPDGGPLCYGTCFADCMVSLKATFDCMEQTEGWDGGPWVSGGPAAVEICDDDCSFGLCEGNPASTTCSGCWFPQCGPDSICPAGLQPDGGPNCCTACLPGCECFGGCLANCGGRGPTGHWGY